VDPCLSPARYEDAPEPDGNYMTGDPVPTLDPLRRKLSYRARLGPEDEAALLALPHVVKSFAPGRRIVHESANAKHSCVMLSGFSFRHKVVANGARQIVSLQMIGDVVEHPSSIRSASDQGFEALTPTDVAFISREEIQLCAGARPAIANALWVDALAEVSIAHEWAANIGRRHARARIAHLLCEWAVRLRVAEIGEETRYELPMSQEQLADALGLTPPHVNRTLKELGEDGLISRTKRLINIADWKKLAKVGDFEPGYLNLRQGEPALA
jgi:CRP-like cAMP-binding protein